MLQKALSTVVSLPCLTLSVLGLLLLSIAEPVSPASALPDPWHPASMSQSVLPIPHAIPIPNPHPAFAERRIATSTLHKREHKAVPTPANDLLPVVRQASILPKHQTIANNILRLLPPWCSVRLQNFVVRYDHPARRGLAGKSTVILSGNVPDEEFRALAVHEILGHFYELGCLDGTTQAVASAYRDGDDVMELDDPSVGFYAISWKDTETHHEDAALEDFVSGYAADDAFEDFAETVVAYVLHRATLENAAKHHPVIQAKLRWMQRYMPSAVRNVATGRYAYTGKRPWDMTKLGYTWHGNTNIVAAGG